MTQDQIKESTRIYLQSFLPQALERALDSYQLFSDDKGSFENSKDFSEHHNACKVAIAHVELLLKLAKWAEISTQSKESDDREIQLSTMIFEAQKHLEQYKNSQ